MLLKKPNFFFIYLQVADSLTIFLFSYFRKTWFPDKLYNFESNIQWISNWMRIRIWWWPSAGLRYWGLYSWKSTKSNNHKIKVNAFFFCYHCVLVVCWTEKSISDWMVKLNRPIDTQTYGVVILLQFFPSLTFSVLNGRDINGIDRTDFLPCIFFVISQSSLFWIEKFKFRSWIQCVYDSPK